MPVQTNVAKYPASRVIEIWLQGRVACTSMQMYPSPLLRNYINFSTSDRFRHDLAHVNQVARFASMRILEGLLVGSQHTNHYHFISFDIARNFYLQMNPVSHKRYRIQYGS